ncbi:hypothetical protein [Xanthomonas tesorieronis]|uniref:hypothetical protein n=1 Tax=Xanthomonas tesorieronis TaxID=3160839 RepID=UPI00351874AD
MNQTVFLMFFFATAPVALMPSVISWLTRHRSRRPIVIANLALWVLIFFAARSFTLGTSSKFQLPTLLALIAWLVLLGYSIRGSSSKKTSRDEFDTISTPVPIPVAAGSNDRASQMMDLPMTWGEILETLGELAAMRPVDVSGLRNLQQRCETLSQHLAAHSELSNLTPELVWHFLADADIRFKDPVYAQMQWAQMDAFLASQP